MNKERRLEPNRAKFKADLGSNFGIHMKDGSIKIATIRQHIDKRCPMLFDYIYNSRKLNLESLSLNSSAYSYFKAKLEKDYPELLKIIAQRKARHNLYNKANGKT
jgi:hypothetical protein